MCQLGFFDVEKRLAALSAKGDPLEAVDRLVPWESFRADIEAVVLTPDEKRKSSAGRKPTGSERSKLIDARRSLFDSYNVLQFTSSSAAADAVAKLAQRFAAGSGDLATLVRRDQDLDTDQARRLLFEKAQHLRAAKPSVEYS